MASTMKTGALPETWFADIFSMSSDPMAITIPETGELIEINRAYEARSGYSRAELLGRTACEMNLRVSPAERAQIHRALRERGTVDDLRVKGHTRSGEEVEVLLSARVLTGAEGRILVSRARVADTAAPRMERVRAQRGFLSALSQSPAALAGDVAGAARMVTESCAGLFNAERAAVWLFDDSGKELRCIDRYVRRSAAHETGAVLPEREHRTEFQALRAGQYVEMADTRTEPRASGELAAYVSANGVTAMLLAALRLGDRSLGALWIEHTGRPHAWEQEEIDFACHVASHLSVVLERRERRRVEERLRKAMDGHVRAMATTVEMRDPYTAGHERRVAQLAAAVAEEMGGFGEHDIEGIRVAAYLHDLGKIAVPAEILSKPGKINSHEFGIIKSHPRVGFDVLKEIDFIWPVAEATLQHHERLDGSGYPRGLKGEQIIPQARIIAVADVVEAMASHRPYRPALSINEALEEIMRGSGRSFDAAVVSVCVRLFLVKGFRFEA
jgi:PAS domain S-box-containing protein/putative nucleotidyltransferase with HDIG domain